MQSPTPDNTTVPPFIPLAVRLSSAGLGHLTLEDIAKIEDFFKVELLTVTGDHKEPTPHEKIVGELNYALTLDPGMMHSMFTNRLPCKEEILDRTHLVGLDCVGGHSQIGTLGFMNMVLDACGHGPIVSKWDNKVPMGEPNRLVGFGVRSDFNPPVNEVKPEPIVFGASNLREELAAPPQERIENALDGTQP